MSYLCAVKQLENTVMEAKIKDYRFNSIVLYAKNWYQHSDNIVDDLNILFSDIFCYSPKNERAVARLMLNVLDDLTIKLGEFNSHRLLSSHSMFEDKVECYIQMFGVARDMAIIYAVLGVLCNLTNKDILLNKPIYGKKEKFRLGCMFGKNPISMTYTEMNRIADKSFSL